MVSPALPVPVPAPWLCSSATALAPGSVAAARTFGADDARPGFWGIWSPQLEEEIEGSVAWQVPGTPGSRCSSLSPPQRAVPGTGQPCSQLENKVRHGRSAGEMSTATFCPALDFIAQKAGAFLLQANRFITQTRLCSPTRICSSSIKERIQHHTLGRHFCLTPAEGLVRSSVLQNTVCMVGAE